METTDEQFITIINQLKAVSSFIPTRPGDINILKILELLMIEHLNLRKKFHVLENSFVDFCAEKRDNLGKEKVVVN